MDNSMTRFPTTFLHYSYFDCTSHEEHGTPSLVDDNKYQKK